MNASLAWTLVFAAALVAQIAVRQWLATRQMRHVSKHRGEVPADFRAAVPLEAHRKAADYTVALGRLGLVEAAVSSVVLLGWTLLGGLGALNAVLAERLGHGMTQQVALLASFVVIGGLIDLPFSLWRTFVLEERFGFNKTSWKLWLADAIKGAALGAAIGLPLAWAVLWVMAATGGAWWLWAWGVWTAFNVLLLLVYPTFIAPIFNQFKPLEDASLKERVMALMARCGFAAKGLFVMDGSRRSAHANAYFTGFGPVKRVVFYDTLLARLDADEVDAVLAHELGHFAHKHIRRRVVVMFAGTLAGFALLGWLAPQTWFYTGLGVAPNLAGPNDALALLCFLMAAPVFSYFVSPLMARRSRRDEFEADAYAASHARAAALRSALLKLHEDNATTLTPDPAYARFYYSHPPATERLARLAPRAVVQPS